MRHLLATVALAALTGTAMAAPEQLQLERADGSAIHYSVDTPPGEPIGTLLLAQGSGCAPTARNANFATVRKAFPNHIAIMVEKYGVTAESPIADGFTDCPPEFHAGHTVSQRVADYESVLATLGKPGPLVLFGGSEGGLAVAMLSQRISPDATIILSSATGMAFADMVLSTIPPEGQEPVRAGLAAAKADPEGLALFAGSSHRFWADIMDHVPADYMLATKTPFLVIQGGRDTSSPVAASRITADRFAAAGRCNLTYWEFPALDHGMLDPSGASHMVPIATAAANWAGSTQTC